MSPVYQMFSMNPTEQGMSQDLDFSDLGIERCKVLG